MVLSTFSCESPTEVGPPAIVTDGTSFRLEKVIAHGHVWYLGRIPYSFTNRTGSTVYVPNCLGAFDVSLETLEAGGWVYVWSGAIPACRSPPIVIEPDEVYETTLNVGGCTSGGNCSPHLNLSRITSAPVRIVWGTGLSSYDRDRYPPGELIPLEERVSNSFRLEVLP